MLELVFYFHNNSFRFKGKGYRLPSLRGSSKTWRGGWRMAADSVQCVDPFLRHTSKPHPGWNYFTQNFHLVTLYAQSLVSANCGTGQFRFVPEQLFNYTGCSFPAYFLARSHSSFCLSAGFFPSPFLFLELFLNKNHVNRLTARQNLTPHTDCTQGSHRRPDSRTARIIIFSAGHNWMCYVFAALYQVPQIYHCILLQHEETHNRWTVINQIVIRLESDNGNSNSGQQDAELSRNNRPL
jgi:hypothetical protein